MEARSLMNGGRNDRKATRKIVSKKGRANVTGAQFISMVDAVEDFIQEVFDREYDLQEAIDLAVTKEDLEAIDIYATWPDNGIPEEDPTL